MTHFAGLGSPPPRWRCFFGAAGDAPRLAGTATTAFVCRALPGVEPIIFGISARGNCCDGHHWRSFPDRDDVPARFSQAGSGRCWRWSLGLAGRSLSVFDRLPDWLGLCHLGLSSRWCCRLILCSFGEYCLARGLWRCLFARRFTRANGPIWRPLRHQPSQPPGMLVGAGHTCLHLTRSSDACPPFLRRRGRAGPVKRAGIRSRPLVRSRLGARAGVGFTPRFASCSACLRP
jgi:hypothetical protein